MPFYRLLLSLVLPLILLRLLWRVLRGQERAADLAQRLGGGAPCAPGALWLHAASVGELTSAQPLIAQLRAQDPGRALVITTNTPTARARAEGWAQVWAQDGSPPGLTARLAPLDARWALRRFFARHRPAALIVVENELWPNRLTLAQARGLPVFVVGARLSTRSARRWRQTGLGPQLMAAITALSAQDAASEAAFAALGLPPARLLPRLNLKSTLAAPAPTDTATPSADPRRATTLLAASTHEGEDPAVLRAFAAARAQNPALRLILAPRHPARAPRIARDIAALGLPFTTRSAGQDFTAPLYLADTLGEMARWYDMAGICFVGGSLVPKGGHTPFEPAAHGCAILTGPHVENAAEPYAALLAAGGARRVTAQTLAQAFLIPAAEQAAMAAAARAALGPLTDQSGPATLARTILQEIRDAIHP